MGDVSLGIRFELIQTAPGAEPVGLPFVHLGVTLAVRDVHTAHGIFRATGGVSTTVTVSGMVVGSAVTAVTPVTPMHVRPAAEAHHHKEEHPEQ